MSEQFPIVRKGYDPETVDAFVQQQADAWRTRFEQSQAASDEWRRRAAAYEERVVELERQLKRLENHTSDRIDELETTLVQVRWTRDQAQSELDELRAATRHAEGQAASVVQLARAEGARIVAAAEEEAERWFASARRRIEMAEAHAAERLQTPITE